MAALRVKQAPFFCEAEPRAVAGGGGVNPAESDRTPHDGDSGLDLWGMWVGTAAAAGGKAARACVPLSRTCAMHHA
jgi:hypothetical protein